MLAIGLSAIPAGVIGTVLQERERKLKHLQLIAGLNLGGYHLVNIAFDVLKAELSMLAVVVVFFGF